MYLNAVHKYTYGYVIWVPQNVPSTKQYIYRKMYNWRLAFSTAVTHISPLFLLPGPKKKKTKEKTTIKKNKRTRGFRCFVIVATSAKLSFLFAEWEWLLPLLFSHFISHQPFIHNTYFYTSCKILLLLFFFDNED